ncbi:hypothetical protein ACPA9J_27365 [Pseudomonas aeruginosa]
MSRRYRPDALPAALAGTPGAARLVVLCEAATETARGVGRRATAGDIDCRLRGPSRPGRGPGAPAGGAVDHWFHPGTAGMDRWSVGRADIRHWVAAARREMHALENFHGLLAGQPLAFFLILGSLSSLLGGGFRPPGDGRWLRPVASGERRRAELPCQLLLGLQTRPELDGLHEVRQRLLGGGLQPLKEEQFVRALETLLEGPTAVSDWPMVSIGRS